MKNNINEQWEHLYRQVSLRDVPHHFAGIRQSPFMLEYLSTILNLCPRGGRTLETGVGSGYGAIWLSLRGVQAQGLDLSRGLVERARQINGILGGSASFWTGDLFRLYADFQARSDEDGEGERWQVIHHQGVLEHFTLPQIRAALAQQVACADHVVFSVPSVYYPFDPEFGNERLLPLEEWRHVLEPFHVVDLRLYGDPQHGEHEHVLCVLAGQDVDDDLLRLMTVPEEPYLEGITAIVQTRNEEKNLPDCLRSLQGFADEIIVCDMESEDRTREIAREFGAIVIEHPRIPNFDRARNVSAMRAKHQWVFFLDADERVPPRLGPALREIVAAQAARTAEPFGGMLIPFKHHFAGKWMQCLYPGYTAPRLLKNGKFVFNARLHSGAQVEGAIVRFPADDPELALVHYSFESLSHYLTKLNGYTDGEAVNLYRDGQGYHWKHAVRHFVQDFQMYYNSGAAQDGTHGFLYAFLSGFYRFEQHAKLYEHRFRSGQLTPPEHEVPASIEEMLEFALQAARTRPLPGPTPIQVVADKVVAEKTALKEADQREIHERGPELVWSGPLLHPSGYGEESRHFALGLKASGYPMAGQVLPWGGEEVDLTSEEQSRLKDLVSRPVQPGFVQVIQDLGLAHRPHPEAGLAIGRTMFETDRLPQQWVQSCNRLDAVWVPSEFNRASFIAAGVAPEKLAVVPGCLDTEHWRALPAGSGPAAMKQWRERLVDLPPQEKELLAALRAEADKDGAFAFLSVFDWTLHKGWDVLLRGFLQAFEGSKGTRLWLKVWSSLGYSHEQLQAQAAALLESELGHNLLEQGRIRFIPERLSRPGLEALYGLADAFVLPSRGEGWGRPYMEAMALGKPVIGTGWSGNTAFMTEANSYLLDYSLAEVPEPGWREVPAFQGHRWAEPNVADLVAKLCEVREQPEAAQAKGYQAREEVLSQYDRRVVAEQIEAEVRRLTGRQYSVEAQTVVSNIEDGDGMNSVVATVPSAEPSLQSALKSSSSSLILPPSAQSKQLAKGPVALRWEGAFFNWHSLGQVNRELNLALLEQGGEQRDIELALVPTEPAQFGPETDPRFGALAQRCFRPLSKAADVHVRHFFPPRFGRPEEGQLVLIQPWEYGYLPESWIEPIQRQVDEVWCYSEYVRQVYLASGIKPEKLQVVPLGVDTDVFRPGVPPYVFTTEPGAAVLRGRNDEHQDKAPFVFLFVGGSLHRKGIDILLEAYRRAFTKLDNVCLVIKDTGTSTVYRVGNDKDHILHLIEANDGPPIVYSDADLSSHQLAGLYASADCLVQPYRGEGFCLPALEAMACGIPVIVPEGGPTDDFVDETVGWRVPAEHLPFEVKASGRGRIGEWDCVGPTWMLEIDPDDLARRMRQIAGDKVEAAQRGQRAAGRAQAHWTWRHSAEVIVERLAQLQHLEQGGEATASSSLLWLPPALHALPTPSVPATAVKKPVVQNSVPQERGNLRHEPTISLVMIVRDEERVLGDCLRTAKPWFDEIVVVDTGSMDRTVEIAEEHGARVHHFPWCDDFSAARNVSLEHATGDWVFWMDADDTLPEECGRKLRELARLAEDRVTGYIAQVHIPAAPGETGFTIVDHVKLFRNKPELRFIGRIHEQILEPIHRAGGTVERSDVYMVHSGYDYSPEGQVKKRARDLTILEKDLADRPDHPFVLFNIGMTAYHMKDFAKAVPALMRCLEVSGPRESTVRKVYAMLAGCHLEQRQLAEAKRWIDRGLDEYPYDPELLFRAGIIYREIGDLPAAERSYVTLLTKRESGHIDSLDVTMTGFKAHHNLGLIYLDMDRPAEAEREFRESVRLNPRFGPSLGGLRDSLVRMRRYPEVQELDAVVAGATI